MSLQLAVLQQNLRCKDKSDWSLEGFAVSIGDYARKLSESNGEIQNDSHHAPPQKIKRIPQAVYKNGWKLMKLRDPRS